jgi:ribonuclease HII
LELVTVQPTWLEYWACLDDSAILSQSPNRPLATCQTRRLADVQTDKSETTTESLGYADPILNSSPNARMPECPNARMPECPNARMPECPNARMPASHATIAAVMAAGPRLQPSLDVEEELWASSLRTIAGVDEVGRGPLAGPVYAAAVVLDPTARPGWLDELRDSKVLLAPDRERLAEAIQAEARDFAIGWASVGEIDGWGIGPANKMAMMRAMFGLKLRPQIVLVDGPLKFNNPIPQRTIVDGDATCCSIAAASIVAKVARDTLMCRLDTVYPEYNFASHKGYATKDHLDRLARYGPCVQHRRSWLAVQRRGALATAGEVLEDTFTLTLLRGPQDAVSQRERGSEVEAESEVVDASV